MAKLRVTIMDEVRNRRLKVDLPDDAAMEKLLPALAKKLGLPSAAYRLTHEATGRALVGDQTLAFFGVREGDVLRLAAAREEVSTMPRKLPVWAWVGVGGVVLLAVAVLAFLAGRGVKPVPTPTVVAEATVPVMPPTATRVPTSTPRPTATPVPPTDTPRPTATKKPALSPTTVPTLVSTQAPTFPFTLKLPANAGWVETDVALQAGQSVIVTAEGVADFGGGDPAVSGTTPDGFAIEGVNCDKGYAEKFMGRTFTIDCLLFGAPWGALVGRIGNGTPFLIGASHQFIASESGKLYLACNDCCDLSDNMGAYSVTVSLP